MRSLALLLALVALPLSAQTASAQTADDARNALGWHLLAPEAGTPGIALDDAYALVQGRTPREVVVAIIDSGVDIAHPDLAPVLWTNEDEIAGNGQDDDSNGYVDDVHGWSFLGGADGRNIAHETLEVTRLLRDARIRFQTETPESDPEGYAQLQRYEAEVNAQIEEYSGYDRMGSQLLAGATAADSLLRERFPNAYDPEDPAALDVGMDMEAQAAQQGLVVAASQGLTLPVIRDMMAQVRRTLDYAYNVDYDPRADIVGDDPEDVTDRFYGNADVAGPDPSHGTGVAGLVAALRGNEAGIDGIAPNTASSAPVRIMAVRAVPDGDERDKDVANAIRYAVDNGAHVINMSFGKRFSPQKEAVDQAARYAAERGVLLVHAAGNDGKDLETRPSYPSDVTLTGETVATWLEVGASTSDPAALAASFSNYGDVEVDLFAPGARVTSLAPGGETQIADGTSFASPVVAGVAALVMAYVPELSAAEVRQVLIDSATPFREAASPTPGSAEPGVFGSFSATGGVVNAAAAVRLALERAGG